MLLAFFSLQVYTVTKFPFKALHLWTRKKVILCCVGIWLLAGLLGHDSIHEYLSPDFEKQAKWWTVRIVVWSINVIIQIVLKILTCWEIFKTRRNSGQSNNSRHRQITTTVMIMVALQIFTAFPYIVILQLHYRIHLPMEIITYTFPIVVLNFAANPIIYFLRLPDYRSSLLSMYGCRKCNN